MKLTYLWIALGSAIGGVSRHWVHQVVTPLVATKVPVATILINMSGSFLIGFIGALAVPLGRVIQNPDARDFIMIGLCGGYTTFSAFSLQTLNLARDGRWPELVINVTSSVAGCLLAVWLGWKLGQAVDLRLR
jgi:CrcB protein